MKKIALIVFRKDETTVQKLVDSIGEVCIPEDAELNLLEVINEDNNIAKAYNEAMLSTDAKYKIYVCEDIEYIDKDIILNMLSIFQSNDKIGMIGTEGRNLIFTNGQCGDRVDGAELDPAGNQVDVLSLHHGMVMTQYDVPWREDLFRNSAITVNAHCVELKRKGFFISTLNKDRSWYKSKDDDGGFTSNELDNYLDEYSADLFPLVSILMPTHERPELFKIALDSVINQTYRNLEIVISDNSNDDRTEQLMKEYLAKHRNIKYLRAVGLRAEENYENCWKHASDAAEYINYLMDDDYFALNKISEMINYFLANPNVVLVTSYRKLIDWDGNELPDASFNKPVLEKSGVINGREAGKYILTNCLNWIGEPTTVLFKSKYITGYLQGWTGKEKYAMHDYSWWLRILEHGDMVYITEPLSFFRQHTQNESKGLMTNVYGTISMASVIKHAWNNRIYLEDALDVRKAILSWYGMALGLMSACFNMQMDCKEFEDLCVVFEEMSKRFAEKEPGQLNFDFQREAKND